MSRAPEQDPRPPKRRRNRHWALLASILGGIAVGHLAPGLAVRLAIIEQINFDLLKMVVLPFMVAVVIFSMRRLLADQDGVTILPRTLMTFLVVFLIAALAGLLAGVVVTPGQHLSPENLQAMGKLAGDDALGAHRDTVALLGKDVAGNAQSLADLALLLIPVNIFAALNQGETLKVFFFSLLFGLAVGRTTGPFAEKLTGLLQTVHRGCLKLTEWFDVLLPFVVFSFTANLTAKSGQLPLGTMFRFLLAFLAGSGLMVLVSLWALRLASRRPWREVLRSQRDPVLVALVTRNSYACMPAMISGLVETLGFAPSRIELLVPLGVSLVRLGTVLNIVLSTVFIAQVYDVRLSLMQLGALVAGSMMAGLASSGMSNGLATLSLTGLMCNYLGLPFEAALALFVAIDPVCEILVTLVGVVGNNAFVAMAAGAPIVGEA